MHWLSRNWWLLLIVGALGGFIYVYAYTKIYLEVKAVPMDTVLDLVLVILALMTLLGYGVYQLIHRRIEDRVENQLREERNELSARLHASTGFVFWKHYQQEEPLTIAITRTRRALEYAERLDEKQYERLICTCKHNLAYYLAEACECKEEAHKLAKYAYERARDEKGRFKHESSYEWEETYAWVLWRFAGEDNIAKEKAHQILDELLSCSDIPIEWREEKKTHWDRLFSQSGQVGAK